jgi:hypothetical protein
LNGEFLWVCVYLRFADFQGKRCPRKGDFRHGGATFDGWQWSAEGILLWLRADCLDEYDRLMKQAGIPYETVP